MERKYVYIDKERVVHRGTEARLSARWDGVGADDSGSECPTVAHMRVIARAGR